MHLKNQRYSNRKKLNKKRKQNRKEKGRKRKGKGYPPFQPVAALAYSCSMKVFAALVVWLAV